MWCDGFETTKQSGVTCNKHVIYILYSWKIIMFFLINAQLRNYICFSWNISPLSELRS